MNVLDVEWSTDVIQAHFIFVSKIFQLFQYFHGNVGDGSVSGLSYNIVHFTDFIAFLQSKNVFMQCFSAN